MLKRMKVALIGCGMISESYLKNLQSYRLIELAGCSDIRPERSRARAEAFGIRQMSNEEILSDPQIEMVVNTTDPLAHYAVSKACLLAGKHVYAEKMSAESVEEMRELQDLAARRGLFLGGAPDTWLGASMQMARYILDSGVLGAPTMASAFLSRSYRHERFYTGDTKRFAFCRHGGIPFDMGAYYLSALVFLLGPIRRVNGFAQIRNPHRTYMAPESPLYGQEMLVESYNQACGSLEFASGALGSICLTSEGGAPGNRFVLHCTDGMIDLGDPNNYEGSIRIQNKRGEESIVHSSFAYASGNQRGIGVLDAAYAIRDGRAPRCSGELCCHVLEAALGICAQNGTAHDMQTACQRPEPLKPGYTEYPELVFHV